MGTFNNRRSFSGGSNEYKQMHKATCSNCGKACEVPFKPNGSKPVLCRDCFRNSNSPFEGGGRTDSRGFQNRSFDSRSENRAPSAPAVPNYSEQFSDLNRKLDKIMSMIASIQTPQLNTSAGKTGADRPLDQDTVGKVEVMEVVAVEDAAPIEEKIHSTGSGSVKAKKKTSPKKK